MHITEAKIVFKNANSKFRCYIKIRLSYFLFTGRGFGRSPKRPIKKNKAIFKI